MAGRVLKEEDFVDGEPKDTSNTPAPEDKVEAKVVEEPEKAEPDKEEPQPKPSDEKKFKHATWEDTEKARVEAERKMTEKAMEAAELKKKLSQYERPVEKPVTVDERIEKMTEETLRKIDLLPSDISDRNKQAGMLWAKLSYDISDMKINERSREAERERDVVKRTYDYATREGIKSEAELRVLGAEFSKIDPSLSVDDRIEKAVSSTKEIVSQLRSGYVPKEDIDKQEKDRKDREDLKVLGRGSSRQTKSETRKEENESMSQQLAKLNEQRRMKKEDLRY